MMTHRGVAIRMADQEAAEIIQKIAGHQAIAGVLMEEVEARVLQVAEEVIGVHLMAGAETVLREVQVIEQLQEVLMAVVIVEEEKRVQHQEATVVLPAMAGEPAEGKATLPHGAGKNYVDPATENRATALFSCLFK